jgi:23S rRNA (cytidine2498-2'-O)-methyltransferase
MNKVVLYCRPGFEKECAAEITDKAAKREVFGFARVKENSGYVVFECYQPDDAEKLVRELPFSSLIFARQMFVAGELLKDLSPEDRITPIVGMLQGVVEKGGDLRVEVADTNESKELMKFCRKFTVPLRAALREAGVLTNYETPKRPVVHIFFIAPGCCYTGYSLTTNNSPFYMGIPRLKFPSDAPSRSTLKLASRMRTASRCHDCPV